MIRVDYKHNGEHVNTTWVKEEENRHSMMGRLLFTKDDFANLREELAGPTYKFEEKKEIV